MKKVFLLSALLIILSGCQSTQTPAFPDWQLVYAHDRDGSPVSGSKQKLIEHAKAGRPIRIVWPIRDDFIHVADAGFLTIMKDELFAQTDAISRQIPDRETRRSIALDAKEQSKWQAIFSTTGQIQSFQSTNGELGSHQFAYEWYVLIPTE